MTLLLAVLEVAISLILVCWPDAVVLKHMVMASNDASNTVNEMIAPEYDKVEKHFLEFILAFAC